MGKIIYDPKKNNQDKVVELVSHEKVEQTNRLDALIENLNSVRPIGDTDCDYAIYLEDYAYTYIYQYAQTDLSCEHSAVVVGEYYPETKEAIICGIMPIPKHKLNSEGEWINQEAVESLYEEKEKYFPGASLLGWLHMQPGYGTMLTMKEVKIHRELFNREGSLFVLVDPINRLETFFVYEDEMLKEQTGYYVYYDKNPSMQHYMLDKPFGEAEKEDADNYVVNQFREIGRRRKKEYIQRKKTNFTVVAASLALLALAAVVVKNSEQNSRVREMQQELEQARLAQQMQLEQNATPPFVFDDEQQDKEVFSDEEVTEIDMQIDSEQEVMEEVDEQVEDEVVEETETSEGEVNTEEQNSETLVEVEETYKRYVVEPGDTLRKISQKYFSTELRAKDIMVLNEIQNGDHIYVGQELLIPNE